MESVENTMKDLERPPTKNNLSVINIIQLVVMLFIGCEAAKGVFDLFKFSHFSIIDLIKIVIDLVVLAGVVISAYGLFTDNSDSMKTGFVLFFYGMLGVLVVFILDWIRGGFGFGSLLEFLFDAFVAYVIYIQTPHI
jgi:hypothetical protein